MRINRCCVGVFVAAILAAADGPEGHLRLVLEGGLPYSVRTKRVDLELALDFRAGRPAARGWAYTRRLAGVEHPVRVLDCRREGHRLQLRLEAELRDQFPYYEGGRATVDLDLRRYGRNVVGEYTVTTAVLDERERSRLWKDRVHMAYKDHIVRGRVRPGTVRSLSLRLAHPGWNPPPLRRARGRFHPLAATGRPLSALDGRRPRLLADGAVLAGRVEGEPYAGWYAQLEAGIADPECPPGAAAAGHACRHLVAGRSADAEAALEATRAALAGLERNAASWWPYARGLVGAATAYDACGAAWPDAAREEVAARLAAEAWHVSGLGAISRDSPFYDKGLIGSPCGGHDPRLAILRAAAALAALAVADAGAPTPDQERVCRAYAACARSVRRYLREGYGERGAPLGHSLHEEALEILPCLVHAARRSLGAELDARSDLHHAVRWGIVCGGWQFDAGPEVLAGPWLPLALAASEPADLPQAAWQLARRPTVFPDPLGATWALAAAPELPAPAPPRAAWDRSAVDHRTGSLVLRSGWDDKRDFVAVFECGSGVPEAAGAMGRFSLYGRGREWIRRDHAPRGAYRWPHPHAQNALQIHENKIADLAAIHPVSGGRLRRLRVTPAGNGSLGYRSGHYRLPGQRDKRDDKAYTWSTMGVDYSGASGADCLLVLVGGHFAFRDREALWPLHLGDVPPSRVRVAGNAFTVRPEPEGPYLRGVFVYPGRVRFAYHPPEAARGGVLEIRFRRPQQGNHEKFLEGMNEKLTDLRAWKGPTAGGETPERDTTIDGLDIADILVDEPERKRREKEERIALAVKAKVYRVTTSNKMGGGDIMPRVVNHAVLVLTVQEGEAPPVVPAELNQDHLLTVGGQTVHYWEYLVEFERGMRDVIRAGGETP